MPNPITFVTNALSIEIDFPLTRPNKKYEKELVRERRDVETLAGKHAMIVEVAEEKPKLNVALGLSGCKSIDTYGITYLIKLRNAILKQNSKRIVYLVSPIPKVLKFLDAAGAFKEGIFHLIEQNVDVTSRLAA